MQKTRAPFHERFLHRNSNPINVSLCSHPSCITMIAMELCTWHDSTAVVACAKFRSDMIHYDGGTLKQVSSWNGTRSSLCLEMSWRLMVVGHQQVQGWLQKWRMCVYFVYYKFIFVNHLICLHFYWIFRHLAIHHMSVNLHITVLIGWDNRDHQQCSLFLVVRSGTIDLTSLSLFKLCHLTNIGILMTVLSL